MPVAETRFRFAGAVTPPVQPVAVPQITSRPDAKGNVDIWVNGQVVAYFSRLTGKLVLKAGNSRSLNLPLDAKGRIVVLKERTRR